MRIGGRWEGRRRGKTRFGKPAFGSQIGHAANGGYVLTEYVHLFTFLMFFKSLYDCTH